MLERRASRVRDWVLFAAAALAPVIAIAVLGQRALSNEADGARREVLLELSTAAERIARELDQESARAASGLAAAKLRGTPASVAEALAGLAPPSADPVVLAPDRTILIPAPRAAPPPPSADARCHELAGAIASQGSAEPARREFLGRCEEARTPTGRYLWPVVALDAAGRGELSGERVAAWIEGHAALLSAAERAATEREAEAALSGEPRARALRELLSAASRSGSLATELRREGAEAAMRGSPDPRRIVTWLSGASAGTLRALEDGRFAGFVIHEGSLERWVRGRAAALPAIQIEVHAGATFRRREASEPGIPVVARVEVAPELGLLLSPADPSSVAHHAARGRRLLIGIGGLSTGLALALAALLFARIRAELRLSELRTDFVAAVSHELRTPIASLRMLAELLEEGRLPAEEHREVFEALGREARRLGETVERLLSFRRMAAGQERVERSRRSVAEPVEASIDAFEEQNPDMPKVVRDLDVAEQANIDASQIRLAVDNLLANARKHAPLGAPYRVSVKAARGGVAISVADEGPGIARRDQKRIWEPFERADDRLSRATEGSGIGLSLVRYVARAHGGEATVESDTGQGASFTLMIPRAKEKKG